MFEPAVAPVRPRVASPVTGDVVLLEDEVLDFVERGQSGVILLLGDRGSGKTTAMRHLAAVLPPGHRISLIDQDDNQPMPLVPEGGIAVSSRCNSPGWDVLAVLRLQPWGQDECIEYLLATRADQCVSVVSRTGDGASLEGSPRWWKIVLDALAEDPALADVDAAVEEHLQSVLNTEELRRSASEFCLSVILVPGRAHAAQQEMHRAGLPTEHEALIYHRSTCVRLAAEAVVRLLGSGDRPEILHRRLPRELAESVGRSLAGNATVRSWLERLLKRRGGVNAHSMAASLLRFAQPEWRPKSLAKGVNLQGAYLSGVNWNNMRLLEANLVDVDFTGASLADARFNDSRMDRAVFRSAVLNRTTFREAAGEDVDFTGANLGGAILDVAQFDGADFVDANLAGAWLVGTSLVAADLTRAQFSQANLSCSNLYLARLDQADLTDAELCGAALDRCDLRQAIVRRTDFREARLIGANLTELVWPAVRLTKATLIDADMTGSRLPQADLQKADLRSAMLGEVDWNGADLRGADLRKATFHMGSSREGLLFSPFASEGTRTGFYTDEYDEQHFKPPEEIRKANLRGCDLRGARIDGVDFYLVDLRDALLGPAQRSYVESCGAILIGHE